MRRGKILQKGIGILLLILFVSLASNYLLNLYQSFKDAQKQKDVNTKILNSVSVKPKDITIDYSKQISIGSPLIFGGSHAPDPSQQDAWNKIAEIGMTSIRKDFFIENLFPDNVTLDDYKKNRNNIQDPKNWNQDPLNQVGGMFENAHRRGIKTIGIVGFAPSWLTYSGTDFGVPKDWSVFEDIVKKTYRIYRSNLDYVEIWNEPNYDLFLDVTNSGMTPNDAYTQIFIHATKAIREVDSEANDGKVIPVGGPVGYDPIQTSTLEALLQNDKTKDVLDFVSYHNYENKHLKEPSWVNYKRVLQAYGKESLPIFITEWNFDPDSGTPNQYNTSDLAIPFTANKFVNFLKMGLAGANYHVIEPLDSTLPNGGEGYMGFYKWINNSAQLLPQAKSWRLISKDMGLGRGPSKIYAPDSSVQDINMLGFTNSSNQQGVVAVNTSNVDSVINVSLKNIAKNSFIRISVYYASPKNEALSPTYTYTLNNKNMGFSYLLFIPKQSAVGLIFDGNSLLHIIP